MSNTLSLSTLKKAYECDQLNNLGLSIQDLNHAIDRINTLPVDIYEDYKALKEELIEIRQSDLAFLKNCIASL
jgi:hypothetical protein